MNERIEHALQTDRLIDITTTGRKTGKPHKIEIAFHYLDEVPYISGSPGTRDWYANLVANPEFTFHLKQSITADIPARATPVLAEDRRREILAQVVQKWGKQDELESFVASSPLERFNLIPRPVPTDSSTMAATPERKVMNIMWRVHRWVYGLSGGRIGSSMGGHNVLRLTAKGRKSGEPRSILIWYFPHGDSYMIVGSNAGADWQPAWYLNLEAFPAAEIQIGRERVDVVARTAEGEERERLWSQV